MPPPSHRCTTPASGVLRPTPPPPSCQTAHSTHRCAPPPAWTHSSSHHCPAGLGHCTPKPRSCRRCTEPANTAPPLTPRPPSCQTAHSTCRQAPPQAWTNSSSQHCPVGQSHSIPKPPPCRRCTTQECDYTRSPTPPLSCRRAPRCAAPRPPPDARRNPRARTRAGRSHYSPRPPARCRGRACTPGRG